LHFDCIKYSIKYISSISKSSAKNNINNMKKGFLILGLCLIIIFSKAQDGKTKSYLWINGGINYASLYEKSKYTDQITGIIGPEAGLSLRVEYPSYWGFEVGGYYSMKGVKFKDADAKVTLDYGGIYGNGLFFIPLKNDDDIFIGTGFYALHAFSGKTKTDSTNSSITFGTNWKRFDGGIQVRAAYQIKNIVAVGLHYDLGLFKSYSSKDLRNDPLSGRNSVVTLFGSVRLVKLFAK
jgi:hypothetical protein